MSVSCMLTHGFSADRVQSYPVAVEEKYDGVRALIVIRPGETHATCYSRAGKEFTAVEILNQIVTNSYLHCEQGLPGLVLDGELDCGTFTETVSQVRRKYEQSTSVVFRAFDMIPYDQWFLGSCVLPWRDRREALESFVEYVSSSKVAISPYVWADSEEEIHSMNRQMIDGGKEGVVVKQPNGIYRDGRTHDWMKLKDEKSEDLKVIGVFEGDGKYKGTTGGIYVDFNGIKVGVGTGFTDPVRHQIWADHHDHNSVVGLTAEVTYQNVTPGGSLRHPAFKGFRIDK